MAERTAIEWCDSTLNFWEGCTKVSTAETGGGGCDHCYAERMNAWLHGGENWGSGAPRRRILTARRTATSWQRNAAKFRAKHGRDRCVFVNSTSDWLDNEVEIEWLVELLDTVRLCPDVTFLLLSKRIGNWAKRVRAALDHVAAEPGCLVSPLFRFLADWLDGKPPENVSVMATVVNQPEADRDVPKILAVPARRRGLSIEPMLGPVDLQRACLRACRNGATCYADGGRRWVVDSTEGGLHVECICSRLNGLHWVIAGGESGPKARPSHPDWFRSLRDQCAAAGVPFLFKQWGEWAPGSTFPERIPSGESCSFGEDLDDDARVWKVGKKVAGRLLDGVTHDGFPEA